MNSHLFFRHLFKDHNRDCNALRNSAKHPPYGSALIKLEKGESIDFRATRKVESSYGTESWSVGLSDMNKLMLFLQICVENELKTGEYNGYMALMPTGKSSTIGKKYDSYCTECGKSGQTGKVKYTITAINDQHVEGEFFAVLYSENEEQVIIDNGKFDIPF